MKNYELKPCEVALVVKALRYTTECGYESTQCQEEVDEYTDMKALIRKLDPQPVQKNAWMVVYDDGSWSRMFEYQYDAQKWASHAPTDCKVVKVTWEE